MQNSMNVEEITRNIDKIKNYNRIDNINFDNITRKLGEINSNYVTTNYNNLVNFQNDFSNKFRVIQKNHYNNEVILLNNVNKYIETNQIVEILFDDLKW